MAKKRITAEGSKIDCDNEDADGEGMNQVVNKSSTSKRLYYSTCACWFARVIVDEAHVLRNPDTLFSESVVQTLTRNIHFLSATPLLNHPRDLRGYLHQLFRRCHGQEWYLENIWRGYTHMYADDFDPLNAPALDTGELRSVMPPRTPQTENLWLAHEQKFALYILDPANYVACGQAASWSPDRCQQIMPRILEMIMIRIGYETSIRMHDGSKVRVGDEIQPCKVYTIQLEPTPEEKRLWDSECETLVPKIIAGGAELELAHRPAKTAAAKHGYGRKEAKEKAEGQINEGIHRKVKCCTTDPRLGALITLNFADMTDEEKSEATVKRASAFQSLVTDDIDYGATMFFMKTRAGRQYSIPKDRLTMASYLAGLSTKSQYTLGAVAEKISKGEKSILVFEYPLTRWYVAAALLLVSQKCIVLLPRKDKAASCSRARRVSLPKAVLVVYC